MKNIKIRKLSFVLLFSTSLLSGCDSFLNQEPQDKVSETVFYKTPEHFEQAANYLYTRLGFDFRTVQEEDASSDLSNNISADYPYGRGLTQIPTTHDIWKKNYINLRAVNQLLEKAVEYTGNPSEIAASVSTAHFFRAWHHFLLLKRYGGVPIVTKSLDVNSGMLYAKRNSRYEVVYQILSDLDKAIVGLPTANDLGLADQGKLSLEAAKSFKALLGFYPRNIQLYEQALLHKSTSVRSDKGRPLNNERLEFLGDAILDAIVGDIVYKRFEGKREGFLTNTRSKIVQRETLNKLAVEIGLDKLIKYSTRSSSHNSYMYGNAFEAFIGAIYLDQGYERCKQFMEQRIINRYIDLDKISRKEVNFKSKLIEWSQKNKMEVSFELIEQFLDHDSNPVFQTEVRIEGLPAGTGTGYSKKESQQNAAQMAIKKVKEPVFMSTVEEFKAQHSTTTTEPEVELATNSETELATELENEFENELEAELNVIPETKPENVLEENTSDNEISTAQPTMEAEKTSQSKSPCDAPESPNRDLQ